MKNGLILTLMLITMTCFSQTKSYVTKVIENWTLEKFPNHYYSPPVKTFKEKNIITGLLLQYSEIDKNGEPSGLLLTMRANGINPKYASYSYKGQVVYMVSFFQSSNIIERVSNMNEKGENDGPQINRTYKGSGNNYDEEIIVYKNGELISVNGVKITPLAMKFNSDSLLDGKFKFLNASGEIFEGEASNGNVLRVKQTFNNLNNPGFIEVIVDSTTFKVNCYESVSCPGTGTFPINCKIKVTNSKNIITGKRIYITEKYKDGGRIDYPYIYLYDEFSFNDFIAIMKDFSPEPIENIAIFNENLLNGKFQFRAYKRIDWEILYVDYSGEANNGEIKNVLLKETKFIKKTGKSELINTYEFTFEKDSFFVKGPNLNKYKMNFDVKNHLKLTNSHSLSSNKPNEYFYFNSENFDFCEYLLSIHLDRISLQKLKDLDVFYSITMENDKFDKEYKILQNYNPEKYSLDSSKQVLKRLIIFSEVAPYNLESNAKYQINNLSSFINSKEKAMLNEKRKNDFNEILMFDPKKKDKETLNQALKQIYEFTSFFKDITPVEKETFDTKRLEIEKALKKLK